MNFHGTGTTNLSNRASPQRPTPQNSIQECYAESGFTAYSHFTLSKAIFGLTRDFLSRNRAQTEAIASV